MSRHRLTELELERAVHGYVTPGSDHFNATRTPVETEPSRSAAGALGPAHHPPNPVSLAARIADIEKQRPSDKVGIRDRICCYQWTWFTMTMATGGVANVLHTIPYRSNWLYCIGLVFFFFNMCLFMINCVLITIRFILVPGSFIRSFTDQVESLFIPAVVVSTATILINICEYGIADAGPWLQATMEVMFWIYIAVSVVASAGMYLILWSTQIFPIHTMTPVWVFPVYPLLLTGPFAASLIVASSEATPSGALDKLSISCCAIVAQGTGFLISFMVSAAFLYRLMTQKLPRDMQRPGVFISIGPAGFTVAGMVTLAFQTSNILPPSYPGYSHAVFIIPLLSLLLGLWLWGLSGWFFLVSVGSLFKYCRKGHKMPFQMTWWSFVFPNTALVTATLALGGGLGSTGMQIFGCVMAAILVFVWGVVFVCMIRAIWTRKILWPKETSD